MENEEFPMRINKYLAHKGLATRRSADALIEKGVVFINGKKAELGTKVNASDTIEVRGKQKEYRYFLYNKPRGIITHSPAPGEEDIVTQFLNDHHIADVFPIGRLDKDSEGLIILTDDGRITGRLLAPEHQHEREYEVTVDKKITGQFLKELAHGVSIEGYMTKPSTVKELSEKQLRLTLTEGKKHQIRRMCAALGYQVTRLVRIRIGNLELRGMQSGQYRILKGPELAEFLKAIGL